MALFLSGFFGLRINAQTNENKLHFFENCESNHLGVIAKTSALLVVYLPSFGKGVLSEKELRSDQPISFGFGLITNKVSVVQMPRPEYGFKISAISEAGTPVELSIEGAKYGRFFDNLKGYDKKVVDKSYGRHPYWLIVGPSCDNPTTRIFGIPDKLFIFTKPGKYFVRIETACFLKGDYLPHINSNTTNYNLIKFPPVQLTVINKGQK